MGPICAFTNQQELNDCLSWWQEKLFLKDWFISATVENQSEFDMEGSCGENILTFEQKLSIIHILAVEDYPKSSPLKYCQEKVLVHELLHCKYNFLAPDSAIYEQKFFDEMDHQRLEEMAKTLIMTKYNLSLDWFKNG